MHPGLIIPLAVIAFLILSFCIYLILIKPEKREGMESLLSRRYAHRGLHNAHRAENSLSAFKAAVDAGYGIELDVRLSSDGELVVFHDDTLERITGCEGRVDEYTAKELSEMKLYNTDDGIPTFLEVLRVVDGKVPLLIELKEDAGKYGVTDKTCEILRDYNGEYMIESFNPLALIRVKKLMPHVYRGILSQNYLERKEFRTPMHFLLQILTMNSACSPNFIAFKVENSKNAALRLVRRIFGVPTIAWTVKSEEQDAYAKNEGYVTTIFEGYEPPVSPK